MMMGIGVGGLNYAVVTCFFEFFRVEIGENRTVSEYLANKLMSIIVVTDCLWLFCVVWCVCQQLVPEFVE